MRKSRGRTRRRASYGWDAALTQLEGRLLLAAPALIGPVVSEPGPAEVLRPTAGFAMARLRDMFLPGTTSPAGAALGPTLPGPLDSSAKYPIGHIEAAIQAAIDARGGVDASHLLSADVAISAGSGARPGFPFAPMALMAEVESAREAYAATGYAEGGPRESMGTFQWPMPGMEWPPGGPRIDLVRQDRPISGPDLLGFPVLDGSEPLAVLTPAPAPPAAIEWTFAFDETAAILPTLVPPDPSKTLVVARLLAPEGPSETLAGVSLAAGEPSGRAEPSASEGEPVDSGGETSFAPDPSESTATPDPIGVGLRLAAPILDPATWVAAVDHLLEGVDGLLGGLDDLGGDDPYTPWVVASALLLTASEVGRRARSRRGLALATVDGSAVEPPDDRPRRPPGA